MRRRIILAVIGLAAIISPSGFGMVAREFDTAITAQHFATLRDDHPALRAFLYRMPKGADLHVHLSGAVYAEPLIGWAAREGLCVRLKDWFMVAPPCTPDEPSVAETMRDQRKFDALVNAVSMRFFLPTPAVPAGRDQFFAAFGKLSEITWRVSPETDRRHAQPLRRAVGAVRRVHAVVLDPRRARRAHRVDPRHDRSRRDVADAEAERARQAGRQGARRGRRHRAQGRGVARLPRRPGQARLQGGLSLHRPGQPQHADRGRVHADRVCGGARSRRRRASWRSTSCRPRTIRSRGAITPSRWRS